MTDYKKLSEEEQKQLVERVKNHGEKYLFSATKSKTKKKQKKKD